MSDDLPEAWSRSPLRSLFQCWGGMTPATGKAAYWERGTVPWLSSKDIKTHRITDSADKVTRAALAETRLRACRSGAVVIVVRSGVLAHSLPVSILGLEAVVNQDLKVLDSGDDSLNEWLALFLRASEQKVLSANRKEGTTVQSIRVEELLNLEMPVPPLAEQRRIVAKVEALLARVTAARERLEMVPLLMKRFRQAVLAKAFRGELVPTEAELAAREGRPYQSAAELLGKPDKEASDDLPEGWVLSWLRDVVEFSPQKPRQTDLSESIPVTFVPMASISESGALSVAEERRFEDVRKGYTYFRPRDVLIAKITPCFENGKAAVVPKLRNGIGFGSTEFHVLRPSEAIEPQYLFHFVHREEFRQEAKGHMTGTAGQARVPKSYLEACEIPLPPLAEQRRIVAKVEALLTAAAKVEAEAERLGKLLERAPQTILQKAFSGELVPSEAELAAAEGREFESATDLLRRIASVDNRIARGQQRKVRVPRAKRSVEGDRA